MRRAALAAPLALVVLLLGWGILALLDEPESSYDSVELLDLDDPSSIESAQPMADLEVKASEPEVDQPVRPPHDPETPPGIEITAFDGEPNLYGIVRHETTGAVCPGAVVQLFQVGRSVRTRTDVSGRFELGRLTTGSATLIAWNEADDGLATLGPILLRRQPLRGVELELEPPRTLEGWSVDGISGARLADVRVQVVPSDLTRSIVEDSEAWQPVETGADGSFRIESCPASAEIELKAIRPGYIEATQSYSLHELDERISDGGVMLELAPAALLTGVVRAANGELVPGADVLVQRQLHRGPLYERQRSDEQGRFELVHLPVGNDLFVLAYHREHGLAGLRLESPVAGPSSPVEIRFEEPGAISGRVTDAAGEPVEGARLTIRSFESLPPDLKRQPGHSAMSDAAGEFRFDQVPPGRRLVSAVSTHAGRAHRPVLVESGELTRLDIQLELPGTIAGQVRFEDGTPVAGALVSSMRRPPRSELATAVELWWERSQTEDASATWTDDEGRFSFRTSAGSLTLVVTGAEIATTFVPRVAVGTEDLVITVERAAWLRIATHEEGTSLPVKDIVIEFDRRERERFLSPDGVFELPGLPSGQHRIEISASGYLPVPRREIQLEAGVLEELFLELQPAASLSGSVRSSAGEAIGGIRIYMTDLERKAQHASQQAEIRRLMRELSQQRASRDTIRESISQRFGSRLRNPVEAERSGDDGTFRFSALRPGRYELTLASSSGSLLPAEEIWLQPGTEEYREIVLEANARAEIEVLGSSGQPIDGARVRLSGGPGRISLELRSSGVGRYTSGAILPGSYQLRVSKRGFRTMSTKVIVEAHADLREQVTLEERR